MPEAAKAHTAAGAEAFVKFYWALVDYAEDTGDVAGLRRIASAECGACSGGVKSIVDIYGAHGRIRGGAYTVSISSVKKVTAGPYRGYAVMADISNSREVLDYPGSKRDVVHGGATNSIRFIVGGTSGRPSMTFWDLQS